MWIFGGIFLVLGGFLLFAGRGPCQEGVKRWEKRFTQAGNWLCKVIRLDSRWVKGREVGHLLLAITAGSLLSFCLVLFQGPRQKAEYLVRGETAYEELLEARVGEEIYQIPVWVQARTYEKEEVEEFLRQVQEELEVCVLNGNVSQDQITKDLYLPQSFPENPVQISWFSQNPEVLDDTGKILYTGREPIQVHLEAQLSCQGEIRQMTWELTVVPNDENAGVKETLQRQLQEQQQNHTGEAFELPQKVGSETVVWSYPEDTSASAVFGLSAVVGLLLLTGGYREQKRDQENRERQMLLDYPEIVNQLTLLLSAGLNTRNAVFRLASDYQKRRQKGGKRRQAYEELVTCCREMEQGTAEQIAYEHLGARCSVGGYKTLTTLLVQNLKKGNKYLLELLEQESAQAFDRRKRQARILGEEAGTKLLFPMILLLGVVFVMILIPAWISFGM